jgi:hypothetical protein
MATPTDILAEDITTVRADIKALDVSVNALRTDFAAFKSSTETRLDMVLGIGKWAAASVTAGFAAGLIAFIGGAVGVSWSASALNSNVEHQGARLDKIESRLDGSDAKLDLIVRRLDQAAPKKKGGA